MLDDLRSNENVSGALRASSVPAKSPQDSLFDRNPISLREARVKQMRGVLWSLRGQFFMEGDRLIDGVADDQNRGVGVSGCAGRAK